MAVRVEDLVDDRLIRIRLVIIPCVSELRGQRKVDFLLFQRGLFLLLFSFFSVSDRLVSRYLLQLVSRSLLLLSRIKMMSSQGLLVQVSDWVSAEVVTHDLSLLELIDFKLSLADLLLAIRG